MRTERNIFVRDALYNVVLQNVQNIRCIKHEIFLYNILDTYRAKYFFVHCVVQYCYAKCTKYKMYIARNIFLCVVLYNIVTQNAQNIRCVQRKIFLCIIYTFLFSMKHFSATEPHFCTIFVLVAYKFVLHSHFVSRMTHNL